MLGAGIDEPDFLPPGRGLKGVVMPRLKHGQSFSAPQIRVGAAIIDVGFLKYRARIDDFVYEPSRRCLVWDPRLLAIILGERNEQIKTR